MDTPTDECTRQRRSTDPTAPPLPWLSADGRAAVSISRTSPSSLTASSTAEAGDGPGATRRAVSAEDTGKAVLTCTALLGPPTAGSPSCAVRYAGLPTVRGRARLCKVHRQRVHWTPLAVALLVEVVAAQRVVRVCVGGAVVARLHGLVEVAEVPPQHLAVRGEGQQLTAQRGRGGRALLRTAEPLALLVDGQRGGKPVKVGDGTAMRAVEVAQQRVQGRGHQARTVRRRRRQRRQER